MSTSKISCTTALLGLLLSSAAVAQVAGTPLPTGVSLTPTAAPGSTFATLNPNLPGNPSLLANGAFTNVLSPDGKTMLVLTSGYNTIYNLQDGFIQPGTNQYIFVYGVAGNTPTLNQVILVPNSFGGIAFAPSGTTFYVAGGADDNIHVYNLSGSTWTETPTPISLGHSTGGVSIVPNILRPAAAGIAVTPDGTRAVVANLFNDSITIVNLSSGAVLAELDLRPGKISAANAGVPGGEYPFGVVATNTTAYVSSIRDREVDVVNIPNAAAPALANRIKVAGNPNKMVLSADGSTLWVAMDNADAVAQISTANQSVVATIPVTAPQGSLALSKNYRGTSTNGLALSPDGTRLYVTNGGTNTVSVVALNQSSPATVGLIPTGFYPSDVKVSADGTTLFVINMRSVPGADALNCSDTTPSGARAGQCDAGNQYVLEQEHAGLLTLPVPGSTALTALTAQALANNRLNVTEAASDVATMASLRANIKHIIYIIKENRTFDQVLGDLGQGNGAPSLTEFGKAITPNLHNLALGFVTLDNFYDSGSVSGNGWNWSTQARETDYNQKSIGVNYTGPLYAMSYDSEGTNRLLNVGISSLANRIAAQPVQSLNPDPDILPGTADVAATDQPGGQAQQNYLWDLVLRGGGTVRNYGFFVDLVRYSLPAAQGGIPATLRFPAATNTTVSNYTNPTLAPFSDPYFRGFDNNFPDLYREYEWEREFNLAVASNTLPTLQTVRLMHDHMGSFGTAIDGVNTPKLQQADNDLAVGRLVARVAASPFANSTLIFVIEDDAQDGADHVDAHRSTLYVAGPYVKQGAVVSTRYTTVNVLRTITEILGLDHLGIYDAYAAPMSDLFDMTKTSWSFAAIPSNLLLNPSLNLRGIPSDPSLVQSATLGDEPDAQWWAAQTKGMDFSAPDKVDANAFNRILWEGLMHGAPYPSHHAPVAGDAEVE